MTYTQPDERIMRIMLGLKPGERARSEDPVSQDREIYQASMAEYRAAKQLWNALSKQERKECSKVEALEWEFLCMVERWTITRDFLNAGKIAADLDFERKTGRGK